MKSVLLLGMGPTAASALESLATQFQIFGVLRDPAAEPGSEVETRAVELGLPVLRVSHAEIAETVAAAQPDGVVISSYDRILRDDVLSSSRFVNVHYSPLPRYRGRANVNWAIINGEDTAAITIHTVVPGLDAGNILFQKTVEIGPHDSVGDLYARLNEIQRRELGNVVARHLDGFEGTPQDESQASYGCTRVPADGEIEWAQSTAKIYALIRGLSPPYPGAHTYLGTRRVVIVRARPVDSPHYEGRVPGRVVARSRDEGYVDVLSGDGVLRVFEVSTDGGPVIAAATLLTSTKQTLGLRSADLLSRIEELESRLRSAE